MQAQEGAGAARGIGAIADSNAGQRPPVLAGVRLHLPAPFVRQKMQNWKKGLDRSAASFYNS